MEWDKDIITSNFPSIDVDRIVASPLPPKEVPHRLVWLSSKNGIFTVKNTYWLSQLLQDTGKPTVSDSRLSRKFWKIDLGS